jgi:radical SAM protein with 4Fe4S-binding SPASM domain
MPIPARVKLIEHLPLATPLALHVFPTYYCNFRCSYCVQSLSAAELSARGFERQRMEFDVFRKSVDDLQLFAEKLKVMLFAGHGEPLLHADIANMIAYAKSANVAERLEIVTNASMFTHEMSDALVEAGVDRLRVSLQGLDSTTYKAVCGADIDFEKLYDNIAYFYAHKKSTDLYVKIIDIALGKYSRERFHSMFDSVCDTAMVEYMYPGIKEIDHSKFNPDLSRTKHGGERNNSLKICPQPFYMAVLTPNGDITGCCSTIVPAVFGNVKSESLHNIWIGRKRADFLQTVISNRFDNDICRECTIPDYGIQDGDALDEYRERLKEIY